MPGEGEARRARPGEAREEAREKEGTREGAFVVHLHDATRRHYDLRFEVGGVLASFAVPKGPCLDPGERRLAVHTEDHPIEYLDFEDVIPRGNYGAGPMILWDRGRVRFLGAPAEQGLARGRVELEFHGHKLRGAYTLVRTSRSRRGGASHAGESGEEWLLMKKADAFASTERDLVAETPRSVLSGLTVEELEHAADLARALEEAAAEQGAPVRSARARPVKPMLCAEEGAPLHGAGWIYELKLDGVRVIAEKDGEEVSLTSRKQREVTELYPEVARAIRALAPARLVLDGEVVALDEAGQPSLEQLARRVELEATDLRLALREMPVVYVVYDLLAVGDRDLMPLPLEARKALLARLIPGPGVIRVLEHAAGDGRPLLAFCCEHGLEGAVAKHKDAPYQPGSRKSAAWVKLLCSSTNAQGERSGRHKRHKRSPEIAAAEGEVSRGHAGSAPVGKRAGSAPVGKRATSAPVGKRAAKPTPETPAAVKRAEPARRVVVTNPDKVLWPGEGITKRDLCAYYEAVAPVMLPYLRDRPVMLVRYPDGIAGKNFHQWNAPPGIPSWIRTTRLQPEEQGESVEAFLIEDVDSLLYVANFAAIAIHVLAGRAPHLEACDFLTVDFDVKQSSLAAAVPLVAELGALLEEIGLAGYPKTSGQTGLHVLVPLGPGVPFTAARALADLLGRILVQRHPDAATMARTVSKRGPRVFVDTGQTGRFRTIAAPYSVRAQPGATVSAPLRWEEVAEGLDPARFTLRSMAARVAELGDPMRGLLEAQPDVRAAVTRLEALTRKKRAA